MKEKNLGGISLIFSLIGILILFYLTYTIEPNSYNINSLSRDNLDEVIKVKGIVESYSETPGLYLITLNDNTGKITIVVFKDEKIELQEGINLEVIGQVVEYENKLEVIAKEIVL